MRDLPSILRHFPAFATLAFTIAVFLAFPQLDLIVSRLFHVPGMGFPVRSIPTVRAVHEFIGVLPKVFVVLLAAFLAFSHRFRYRPQWRRAAAFTLLLLLLGPGLVVNVFKEGWGRARPVEVHEFGGPHEFTAALVPSSQCATNCSFTSGHAATGFALMAPAFFLQRRRRAWLATGVAAGLAFGLLRIAQGGHFLSDVLFSGWIVYGTAVGISTAMALWRQGHEQSVTA